MVLVYLDLCDQSHSFRTFSAVRLHFSVPALGNQPPKPTFCHHNSAYFWTLRMNGITQ